MQKANSSKSVLVKIDNLIKQLDLVNHIATSNYWITTDELSQLLELDTPTTDMLRTKEITFSFSWRNFICTYINRQTPAQYWSITKRTKEQDVVVNTVPNVDINSGLNNYQDAWQASQSSRETSQTMPHFASYTPKPPHLSTSGLPTPSPYNQTQNIQPKVQKTVVSDEVLHSTFAQIDNFLPPHQLESLYAYVLAQESNFVSTSNSANDPFYRRSLFLPTFTEFSTLMIERIKSIVPGILTYLNLPSFAIDNIETQLTAHNDGNYYKIHNDSGSPDSATRELTYVYYFHSLPKAFTGGELLIYDSKIKDNFYVAADSYQTVQPRNNSIVFFLSRYMHEVLPVSCPSQAFRNSRFTVNGWVRRSSS
jgi:Rps23 Pro-64 3,4-dihydroxylase Tpa1-like proline 4-hydroxylase